MHAYLFSCKLLIQKYILLLFSYILLVQECKLAPFSCKLSTFSDVFRVKECIFRFEKYMSWVKECTAGKNVIIFPVEKWMNDFKIFF